MTVFYVYKKFSNPFLKNKKKKKNFSNPFDPKCTCIHLPLAGCQIKKLAVSSIDVMTWKSSEIKS